MPALRTIRRTAATTAVLAWLATLGTALAMTVLSSPTALRLIGVEITCASVAVSATFAYAIAQLTRAHIDDIKWALSHAEDRADDRMARALTIVMPQSRHEPKEPERLA